MTSIVTPRMDAAIASLGIMQDLTKAHESTISESEATASPLELAKITLDANKMSKQEARRTLRDDFESMSGGDGVITGTDLRAVINDPDAKPESRAAALKISKDPSEQQLLDAEGSLGTGLSITLDTLNNYDKIKAMANAVSNPLIGF